MDNVIAKRTQFGKIDERLNIDVVPKSAVAMEYDEQIAHAERELKAALEELNKQRTTALERELKGEITAEQRVRGLQRYEDAVTIAQREVLRLKEAKGRGIRAAKESEISLFGLADAIVIAQRQFAHLSAKEARKAAKEYARKHLQGRTILNEHTGWEIIVTGRGIDHALRTKRSYKAQEQSEAIIVLAEVLRQAIKEETEAFRYNAKSDIVAVHKFYAALTIEQTPYTIKITVKEKSDGRRFYDYSLLEEIKKSCQHTRIGDTFTSIPYPPSDRIENKITTSSLKNQELSETSVHEVKAKLLARR